MSWALSEAVMNDAFLASFGEPVVIMATSEVVTGAFDRPSQTDEQYGAPQTAIRPELLVRDADAIRMPAGTELRVRADTYTVLDAADNHDGLTRLRIDRHG